MKKKIIIISLLLATIVSFGVMKMNSSTKKDYDAKEFLLKAGFNKIPELISYSTDATKNFWMDKYGLFFVTNTEMDSLLLLNNFIIGSAKYYKESIPVAAVKEMETNYKKVSGNLLRYRVEPHQCWEYRADHMLWFSENEVGYWMSGEDIDYNHIDLNIISDKLENRLSKKGVKVLKEYYKIFGSRRWSSHIDESITGISIVGDKSKFDTTGMVILNNHLLRPDPPRRDPIAVIQHRGGYVILARWD